MSFFFSDPEPVIRSAVQGTLSILESAAKELSIRQFVLLSSIAAIKKRGTEGAPLRLTEADWNDFAEEVVAAEGKNAPGPAIYAASKTAGEKAFWKFRDEHKPAFSMTAVNPAYAFSLSAPSPSTGPPANALFPALSRARRWSCPRRPARLSR